MLILFILKYYLELNHFSRILSDLNWPRYLILSNVATLSSSSLSWNFALNVAVTVLIPGLLIVLIAWWIRAINEYRIIREDLLSELTDNCLIFLEWCVKPLSWRPYKYPSTLLSEAYRPTLRSIRKKDIRSLQPLLAHGESITHIKRLLDLMHFREGALWGSIYPQTILPTAAREAGSLLALLTNKPWMNDEKAADKLRTKFKQSINDKLDIQLTQLTKENLIECIESRLALFSTSGNRLKPYEVITNEKVRNSARTVLGTVRLGKSTWLFAKVFSDMLCAPKDMLLILDEKGKKYPALSKVKKFKTMKRTMTIRFSIKTKPKGKIFDVLELEYTLSATVQGLEIKCAQWANRTSIIIEDPTEEQIESFWKSELECILRSYVTNQVGPEPVCSLLDEYEQFMKKNSG